MIEPFSLEVDKMAGTGRGILHRTAMAWGALLAAALLLRLPYPLGIWVIVDQVRDLERARGILAGRWPLEGPRIGVSNLHLGPLYYALVAAGLRFRDRPEDASLLLSALNALGVMPWTLFFQRLLGVRGGWLAGWLLAVHPLLVQDARPLWNVALLFPALGWAFLGLWLWGPEGRPLGVFLALAGFGAALHAHVVALFAVPAVWLVRRRLGLLRTPWGLAGVALAALLLGPWVAVEGSRLLREGLRTPWAVARDVSWLGGRPAVPRWLTLLRALAPEVAAAPMHVHPGLPVVEAFTAMGALVAVLAASGFRSLGRRAWLFAALVLPAPFLFAWTLPYVQYYYLSPTLPFRVALAVAGALRWGRLGARLLVFGACLWGGATLALIREQGQQGVIAAGPGGLDFRRPLRRRDVPPALFPTWRAAVEVWGVLRGRFGVRSRYDLIRRGRGPWWVPFADDAGLAPRQVDLRSSSGPVLILHRDEVPPEALLGVAAGPFRVWSPVAEPPRHGWIAVRAGRRASLPVFPQRPPPFLPADVSLELRSPPLHPPPRHALLVTAWYGARLEAVFFARRRLLPIRRDGHRGVVWAWFTLPREEGRLRLRLRTPPAAGRPFIVDAVWVPWRRR